MDVETFFEKFELLADAPDALTKMRGLILELSTQGRLVGQDSDEGDGASLLAEIRAAHENRKVNATQESADETPVATIPKNWVHATLGEVTNIIRGVTFPGSAKSMVRGDGDVACLRTASVQAEIDWEDLIFISPTHVRRNDQWVAVNDVIISMANSYDLVGKVAVVRQIPQKATFGGFLAAIRPIRIHPYFLLYVLRSPGMQAAFRASSSQTTNIANISLGRMRPLPFPLPPLAEQKRIVAKVDELMALCDRLEQQQAEREAKNADLARAALARFADDATPANLEYLFHESFTVNPADLRKSILSLAVQGQLVEQRAGEEPASAALQRAREIQRRPMRTRAGSATSEEQNAPPCSIPRNWEWARFGDLPIEAAVGLDRGRAMQGPEKEFGYFKMNNIRNEGGCDLEVLSRVDANEEEVQKFQLAEGDFLFNTRNSRELVGKTCVYAGNASEIVLYNNNILRASFGDDVSANFLDLWFRSEKGRVGLDKLKSNTTNVCAIYQGKLAEFLCPFPPPAEQRRIVAKVDQLMALVDQLEVQLAESRLVAGRLMEAVVAGLTNTERRADEA